MLNTHKAIPYLFGLCLLVLLSQACGPSLRQDYVPEGDAAKVEGAEDFAGEYFTAKLGDGKPDSIYMVLKGNGRSTMILSRGGQARKVTGEWSRVGQDRVQVILWHGKREPEEVLEFETVEAGLEATQYNTDLYGENGFTLRKE